MVSADGRARLLRSMLQTSPMLTPSPRAGLNRPSAGTVTASLASTGGPGVSPSRRAGASDARGTGRRRVGRDGDSSPTGRGVRRSGRGLGAPAAFRAASANPGA